MHPARYTIVQTIVRIHVYRTQGGGTSIVSTYVDELMCCTVCVVLSCCRTVVLSYFSFFTVVRSTDQYLDLLSRNLESSHRAEHSDIDYFDEPHSARPPAC